MVARMKKILIRGLIVVVILIVVAVIGITLFLDGAIKKGVETVGPKITKVDIKLDGVSLSILSGSGSINGLVVGNPEGYKTPHAISVGKASLSLSPGSLLSDKIVVYSVRVESPEIIYELGSGGNNLRQILANVEAAAGGGTEAAPAETEAEAAPGKKIQVNDFVITGAMVKLSATMLGGAAAPIPLPDIHLTNLGTGTDGITAADLTKRVMQEVTQAVAKAVAGAVTDLGKGAADLTKDAGKTATESVEKATKSVTDLFKKKKEE
jgi:hypothetical protein